MQQKQSPNTRCRLTLWHKLWIDGILLLSNLFADTVDHALPLNSDAEISRMYTTVRLQTEQLHRNISDRLVPCPQFRL